MRSAPALVPTICLAALVLIAGCAAKVQTSIGSTTTQAHKVLPASQPALAIVYCSDDVTRVADRITPAQASQILKASKAIAPNGDVPWFALVTTSGQGKDYLVVAEVYYAPRIKTPRLRRGKFAVLYATPGGRSLPNKPGDADVRDYAQVSPATKPFSDQLQAPAAGIYLPFPPPQADDCKLVRLLDAFYDVLAAAEPKYDERQRITSFGREQDDSTSIYIGYGETSGEYFRFHERSDGTFTCESSGVWAV